MGISVGDINIDGQFDIVYTNYAAEVNVIAQLVDKTAN